MCWCKLGPVSGIMPVLIRARDYRSSGNFCVIKFLCFKYLCKNIFMLFIFVVHTNHKNIFTAKISGSMVGPFGRRQRGQMRQPGRLSEVLNYASAEDCCDVHVHLCTVAQSGRMEFGWPATTASLDHSFEML